jgi:hypothetical protein
VNNAVWLFLALPTEYFPTILAPFREGILTAIPALGVVCLAIGVVLGIARREAGLLMFAALPAASQILVSVAGFMRGSFRDSGSHPILLTFLLLQLVAAGYLVWRMKGARWPAAALAVFSLSYALFAAFIAVMAFNNDWL